MALDETTTTTTSSNNDKNNGDSGGGGEQVWGTLEELLLVCAVNRYGSNSWNAVAIELHKQRRLTFSANNCRLKYVDLKRRYNPAVSTAVSDGNSGGEERESGRVVVEREAESELLRMVEELRKLRVEQLKREVHNHDVSIVSLQKKVKRLQEERENDTKLAVIYPEKQPPPQYGGELLPKPEPSDLKTEAYPNAKRTSENDTEPEQSSAAWMRVGTDSAEDWSGKESKSNKKREEADRTKRRVSGVGESVSEWREEEQSGEVQSSVRLWKKRGVSGWRGVNGSGDELEGEEISPANKRMSVKSEPLIGFLDILRCHKHGSVFQRRLPSQETEKFRNLVRLHMDLDAVQSRLERGIYCESHPKFYRDLLLIFTNAVLFYRKSSAEHLAAKELRRVVLEEIALRIPMPEVKLEKPDPDIQQLEPVVKKPRSSTTMVVCRRRTSIQGLSDSVKSKEESHVIAESNNTITTCGKLDNGRKDKPKVEQLQEKVIGKECGDLKISLTRERSNLGRGALRLSNNNGKKIISKESDKKEKSGSSNNNKQESSLREGVEPKEKKKISADQKQGKTTNVLKKQGVANFLKRIKQNSPPSQEKSKNNGSDGEGEEEGDGVDGHHQVGRKEKMDSLSNSNGKKTGGNSRKNHGSTTSKEVDAVVIRRMSGRSGEKEVTTSRKGIGRPPKRKAATISNGKIDSKKGGRYGGEKGKKKPRK